MSIFRVGAGLQLRSYQKRVFRAFDNGKRWIVLLWSRRAGKSLMSWLLLIREAERLPGTYWYCFNNYSTAYNDIWLAMTKDGVRFLDMIPRDTIVRMNSAKLEIELSNGSVIKLVGINNVDKLVGAGLRGVVFDEYAVLNPSSIELVTAMLAETGGWRVIISTPRGKNHFFDAWNFAKAHPEFAYTSNVNCDMDEVSKYMAKGFLEQERMQIISKYGNDALYRQEYLTSWVSPNSGSVFGDLVKLMKDDGRICHIERDDSKPFYTAWDLGNCLSGDVDVLTPAGWVNIKERPDRIAVWRGGKAWFERVEPFGGYLEEAVHIKGPHIDITVSPNHKMMIYDNHHEREILAADIKPRSHKLVKNSKIDETPVDKWDLLNIMVQADGCLVHKNTGYYRVSVKRDRKKKRCEELLRLCDIDYKKTDYADGFTKYGFHLPKTRNWKNLDSVHSNNQANLDELVKWDGHLAENNTYIYESTVEGCAEKVHAMATSMGYTPFIHKITDRSRSKGNKPMYRVTFSRRPKAKYTWISSVEKVQFNNSVYCFKTKVGWFVARDKNKNIFISGNADYTSIVLFQADESGYPLIVDHIENRNEDASWYVGEMKERGWNVSAHFLPHDGAYHKGARNETYKQVLEGMGVRNVVTLNKAARVEDKLGHLRRKFSGMVIDSNLTRIVECLEKMEYEWNERDHVWSSKPTHRGGYSDTIDSLCYCAQAIEKYNLTSKSVFSTFKVVSDSGKSLDKKEQLSQLLERELAFDKKKDAPNKISLFI